MSETTEHKVMRALVDWINENEHFCPGCGRDVSADKLGDHWDSQCPVLATLKLTGYTIAMLEGEFEL